jgi:protein archease
MGSGHVRYSADRVVDESTVSSDLPPAVPPFEMLEHPGDIKIRARGASLAELFANAARGMMAYLFGDGILSADAERFEPLEIRSRDREALLVDWLSELLYRATSNYQAYVDFEITEIANKRLTARAGAVSAEAVDDIKAVTHHELSIRQREDGWEATMVFDI